MPLRSGALQKRPNCADSTRSLYIGNLGNSTVTVYSAPIASNSSPTFILTIANSPFAIFGIAVGK